MEKYLIFNKNQLLVALFNDKIAAEEAYHDLTQHGYTASEINVLMSKEAQIKYYGFARNGNKIEHKSCVSDAFLKGKDEFKIEIKDTISLSSTNLSIPWPGLVVSGPIAGEIIGKINDGYSCAITNAFIRAGMPEDSAQACLEGLKNGKIVITVSKHKNDNLKRISEKWTPFLTEEVIS